MTDEQILALRPGDPIVAHEVVEDDEGLLGVRSTPGVWNLLAINHLRARIGAAPLPDNEDDDA